ncbi:hypothetical protein ACXHXM_34165
MTFSAKYDVNGHITAGPLSDGRTWSGITPTSRLWGDVQNWVKSGGVIAAYEAPAEAFKPIPRYDFWLAVGSHLSLTKDTVLAAIDASDLSDDDKYYARLGINEAQTYLRDDPNVISLLDLMGYSASEADDFWRWAQPT